MEKIRLFSMFSGYGGAEFGLKKANIPYEVVGFSEVDKYAIQCYEQNHGDIKNFGDCTKINPEELPDFDLLTGGFPCQAFSVAGRGDGELDPRGTLFYDIIRVAEEKQPKYILLENVKGLLSETHETTFKKILSELKRIGYHVRWQVFNSKDYGIPQNRERIFFICFKDTCEAWTYIVPKKDPLQLLLKDILEDVVDEKYYLSEDQMIRLLERTEVEIPPMEDPSAFDVYNKKIKTDGICPTLTEPHHNSLRIVQVNDPIHSNDRVYSSEGLSPTINTMQGGNRQPFILSQPLKFLNRNQKNLQGRYSGCIDSCNTNGVRINSTIRKLTPKECFRLMGFLDDRINLKGISNSQRYKLAGNGWDINLVSKIFKKMLV